MEEGEYKPVELSNKERNLSSTFRAYINGQIDRKEYQYELRLYGAEDLQELNTEKKNEILNAIEFGEAEGKLGELDREAIEAVKFNLNIPYGSERTERVGGNSNVYGVQYNNPDNEDTAIYLPGKWNVNTLIHEGTHKTLDVEDEEKVVRSLDLIRASINEDKEQFKETAEFMADQRYYIGDAENIDTDYAKRTVFSRMSSDGEFTLPEPKGAGDSETIANNRKKIGEKLGLPVDESGYWSEEWSEALDPYPNVREVVGKLMMGEKVTLDYDDVQAMSDKEFGFFVNLIPFTNNRYQ